MKLAIVTGVSRGLGEATAKELMSKGCHVIGVSRNDYDLSETAVKYDVHYTHYSYDLGQLTDVNHLCNKIADALQTKQPTHLFLVNNAAVLKPVDQAKEIKNEDFSYHVQVNTVAPMALINTCLRLSTDLNISFTGVTITSGAAERPIYGWSAYCSTKASINMYTKTVGIEQEQRKTGHHIIAFSPGIMDTHMQKEIRQRSKEQFMDVETFRQYKEQNHLQDPVKIGHLLVNILMDSNVQNGKIYNVSDYL